MMTLNEKLTHLRKKEGLSQIEVSEKLAVSRQAVSRWEAGESRPSTDNLQALCKLYHVPLDYLLNESESELPVPAAPVAGSEPEPEAQKKEKRWIRWLVIGAIILALLISFLFWYGSRQKENSLDLHSIQGEDGSFLDEPDFDLNFE